MTSAGATSSDPENTSSDTRTCARNRSGSERTGARRGSDRSTSRSVSSSSTRAHIVAGARAREVWRPGSTATRWKGGIKPPHRNLTTKPLRGNPGARTQRAARDVRRVVATMSGWRSLARITARTTAAARAEALSALARAPFPRPDDAHRARRVRRGAHRRRRSPRPPSPLRSRVRRRRRAPPPLSPRVPRQDSHARHDLPRLPRRAPRGEHPRPEVRRRRHDVRVPPQGGRVGQHRRHRRLRARLRHRTRGGRRTRKRQKAYRARRRARRARLTGRVSRRRGRLRLRLQTARRRRRRPRIPGVEVYRERATHESAGR